MTVYSGVVEFHLSINRGCSLEDLVFEKIIEVVRSKHCCKRKERKENEEEV